MMENSGELYLIIKVKKLGGTVLFKNPKKFIKPIDFLGFYSFKI